MATDDVAALRQIYGLLMEMKDDIILRLVGKDTLSTADVQRIRKIVDAMRATDVAEEMRDVLGDYTAWAVETGMRTIDAAIGGAEVASVLRVPQTTIDVAAQYDPSLIKTIAPELLDQVREQITLSFLGQRTPAQIAARISDRFDVSMRRAETIVRTEGKRLQNFGAEARIQDVHTKAKELGIPMVKFWIHSSGSHARAGKAVAGAAKRSGFKPGKVRQGYQPRPHHKAMHGVTVPVDEAFQLTNPRLGVTWEIAGPHDPKLPAGECVNCYCDRSVRIDRTKLGSLATPPALTPAPPRAPAPAPRAPAKQPAPRPPAPPPTPLGQPVAAVPTGGAAVSKAYRLPKGAAAAAPRRTLKIIDSVHDDGALTQIPIGTNVSRDAAGIFRFGSRTSYGKKIAKEIAYRRTTKEPLLTLAHEIGHHLDLDTLGDAGDFASGGRRVAAHSEMQGIIDACRASDGVRDLQASRGKVVVVDVSPTQRSTYKVQDRMLDYLLDPREMWARAYSQFIAVESGDPAMLAELKRVRETAVVYRDQWSDEDFEPIRREIKKLFEAKGWLKKRKKS